MPATEDFFPKGPTMLKRALVPCLLVLALAACSDGGSGTGGFGVLDSNVHKVSKTKKLDTHRALSISPNGRWLAELDEDGDLCIATVGTSKKHCEDKVRADEVFLNWSPDSSKIAFTEPFFRDFLEPDIWTVDAASGKTTNLTDDHVKKVQINKLPGDGHLDTFPTWTDDGDQITFLRLNQLGEGTDEVMTVPADGGEAKKVGSIKVGSPVNGFTASPDGDRIAWSEGTDLPAKVYVADSSGENSRKVTGSGKADNALLRFSADGDYLLMNNLGAGYNRAFSAHVVTVDDAKAVDLGPGSLGAAWSQSGHALLFIRKSAVEVLTDPAGDARTLSGGKDYTAGNGFQVWSGKNTIVYFRSGEASLLTLS